MGYLKDGAVIGLVGFFLIVSLLNPGGFYTAFVISILILATYFLIPLAWELYTTKRKGMKTAQTREEAKRDLRSRVGGSESRDDYERRDH